MEHPISFAFGGLTTYLFTNISQFFDPSFLYLYGFDNTLPIVNSSAGHEILNALVSLIGGVIDRKSVV
jgi:hypothetical protein